MRLVGVALRRLNSAVQRAIHTGIRPALPPIPLALGLNSTPTGFPA